MSDDAAREAAANKEAAEAACEKPGVVVRDQNFIKRGFRAGWAAGASYERTRPVTDEEVRIAMIEFVGKDLFEDYFGDGTAEISIIKMYLEAVRSMQRKEAHPVGAHEENGDN